MTLKPVVFTKVQPPKCVSAVKPPEHDDASKIGVLGIFGVGEPAVSLQGF